MALEKYMAIAGLVLSIFFVAEILTLFNFMINQSNKTLNTNITKLVNQPYKYGFSTKIEKDIS